MNVSQDNMVHLVLAPHDVRVTGANEHALALKQPMQLLAFVRMLIERYGSQPADWIAPGMVPRQTAPSLTVQPVYQRIEAHVAPHLTLTFRADSQHPAATTSSTGELLHRLVAREERVELVVSRRNRVVAHPDPQRSLPAEMHADHAEPREWSVASTGSRSPNHQPSRLQPEIDVNRLTDQVIQAIDRRISAQRERIGRI